MNRILLILFFAAYGCVCWAENIDPANQQAQFAWGENVGWINFEPSQGGIHVYDDHIEGFVWAENIGWINMWPSNGYGGVHIDEDGNLGGFAWGENVGWINFSPTVQGSPISNGVGIDQDGNFGGFAWGENIGWINFTIPNNAVKVCVVGIEDFALFMDDWLGIGQSASDLNNSDYVNLEDYSVLSNYWLRYCPLGWKLR